MSRLPKVEKDVESRVSSSFSSFPEYGDSMKRDGDDSDRSSIDMRAKLKEKKITLDAKSFVKSIQKYDKATSRVNRKVEPIQVNKQNLLDKHNARRIEKAKNGFDILNKSNHPEAQSLIDSLKKINDGISKLTEEIKQEKIEIRMEQAKRTQLVNKLMDLRKKQDKTSAPASARRDRRLNQTKVKAVNRLSNVGGLTPPASPKRRNLLSPIIPT